MHAGAWPRNPAVGVSRSQGPGMTNKTKEAFISKE
jgi:hypothetical protein